MIYVPKNLEEEISAKISAYQKIKDLTEKISEINYAQLKLKKKEGVFKIILNCSNKHFNLFDLIDDISDLR